MDRQGAGRHLHLLLEVTKIAYADRDRRVADSEAWAHRPPSRPRLEGDRFLDTAVPAAAVSRSVDSASYADPPPVPRHPAPFVVGLSGSSTTLLPMMIDANPSLAIPTGTFFIASPRSDERPMPVSTCRLNRLVRAAGGVR